MTKKELLTFLQNHHLGVLATVTPEGDPESAVVGIAVTDRLELIFDTLDKTRKCKNLRRHPKIAFVIGWDEEITVQLEGVADEPKSAELKELQNTYFKAFPDGPQRLSWPGITYFRVKPQWIRYSDFNEPQKFVEFNEKDL